MLLTSKEHYEIIDSFEKLFKHEDLRKEQNLVSESALTKAKASFYNVPYLDLDTIPISPDALSFVTVDIALQVCQLHPVL